MMRSMTTGQKLIDGNMRFRETNTVYKDLANGQHPSIVVIACSDSRVAPEIITGSELGEIFDVRAIGQALDQSVIGSVEYPVAHLGVKEIAIIGHTKCGAVTAAQQMLSAQTQGGETHMDTALDNTIASICRGLSKNGRENLDDLTHAVIDNAMEQARRLVELSGNIRDAVASGAVRISIWLYDIGTGVLKTVREAFFDKDTGSLSFKEVA